MLKGLHQTLTNMRTLKDMFSRAEAFALNDQQTRPGAEHFLLAAMDMPDGKAREMLADAGGDPDQVADAIAAQYQDALAEVGVTAVPSTSDNAKPARRVIYDADASGKDVIQRLSKVKKTGPLSSADLLKSIAAQESGTAIRALQKLGVDPHRIAHT